MRMKVQNSHLPTLLGVFLLIVAVRCYIIYQTGMRGADDAFITYRYAEHIAAGSGFVYNIGERVLGVTTPLYAILLALFSWLHLPLPAVSQTLGIAASGAIGVLLFLYSRRIIATPAAIAAPLLYAFWPNAMNTDISGMEMTLFALAVLAFFYTLLTARYRSAIVVASLSALLRPEGLLLIGLFFLFKYTIKLHNFKRDYLPDIVIVCAFVLPWIVFATVYFGSPIPNSVSAKLALYGGLEQGGALRKSAELLNLSSMLGWLTLLGALWGIAYSLMRVYWGWLEALFFLALLSGLALSDTHIFFWYKAPLTLFLVLFSGIGVAGLIAIASNFWKNQRAIQIVGALIIITAVPVVGNRFSLTLAHNKKQANIYKTERQRAGEYLTDVTQVTTNAIVVAEDIGYPGYYYRGRIIDRDGLVSPEAIQRNREDDYIGFLEDCLAKYPEHWLTFNLRSPTAQEIIDSGILRRQYKLLSDFALDGSQDYLIYRALRRAE